MLRRLPVVIATMFFVAIGVAGCGGDSEKPEIWSVVQSINYGLLPRWSPDGSMIAFGDNRPGQSGIGIIHASSDPEIFGDLPPSNWDYCWSPDGDKIAFTSPAAAEDSLGGVWIVDITSHELTRIWDNGRDVSWGDSASSLFFQLENPVGSPPGIYSITLGDTTPRLIAERGLKPQGRPNSREVAYADGSIDGRVWVTSEGGTPVAASDAGALQWDWSGDGNYLYVIVNRYTSGVVRGALYRVNGDDPSRSDSLTTYAAYPSSNRSGSQIAFVRNSGATWLGIWLHRSGSDVQIVSYGENPDLHPSEDKVVFNVTGGGIQVITRTQ